MELEEQILQELLVALHVVLEDVHHLVCQFLAHPIDLWPLDPAHVEMSIQLD